MSAPDTNIEKQTERHWPPLLGIGAALFLGIVIGLFLASLFDDESSTEAAGLEFEPTSMTASLHAA